MRLNTSTGKIILLLLTLFALGSCSYRSKNLLFKTPQKMSDNKPVVSTVESSDTAIYRHRIKIGDRLMIRFLNNYDIGQAATQSATSSANTTQGGSTERGYLVNYDSTATLPLVGRTNLVGYTRLEAAKVLETLYSKFIVNPIIDVNIVSLSVTILGEISVPGKILVDKENTTVVDIIALAGGIKDAGKKKDIKIIRGHEVINVNLREIESLYHPKMIIHDNDIIYIEPYHAKAALEPLNTAIPAISLLLSVSQLIIISLQLYSFSR